MLVAAPAIATVVGLIAVVYTTSTGGQLDDVLFSGQNNLGHLLSQSALYPLWTLVAIVGLKGLAYTLCLAGLRGGPIFPSMFIGAAGGLALAHLPGLNPLAGAAMGIGAMCVAMLRLPLTSVLLATLLLVSNGVTLMPLVIVAVVVAHVLTARLTPVPATAPPPARPA
jgi:H+/Cl- antiporter ClcA